ncbi:hypothetical protein [Achromobacter xylosoxidans]|uniref:phage adaptor protein n=1 Tax=Alcaligenes xylosoxydans xylosoxydans TaxID=85698 RepID=UPI001EEB163E|nr:hypothetical protein [Achromobacter xylosoxidans]
MTTISDRYRTLGELRRRLRARLGFAVQGPAADNNRDVLNDFLLEGHEFILSQVGVSVMRKKCVIKTSAGSWRYDWHNDDEDEDIDPSRVLSVWVVRGDSWREPLFQGITERQRELTDMRDVPERYDTLNGQMELWPIPGGQYDVIVEYTQSLGRFEQDADRPSVPGRLVFLYALSNAKAHYRHPDAQVAGQTFNQMLAKFKSDQHENRRYVAGTPEECAPRVVRTADGGFILGR